MKTLLEIIFLAGLNVFLFGYVQRKMAFHLLAMHQQLTGVQTGRIIEVDASGDKVWEMAVRHNRRPNKEGSYSIYKLKRVTELKRIMLPEQ